MKSVLCFRCGGPCSSHSLVDPKDLIPVSFVPKLLPVQQKSLPFLQRHTPILPAQSSLFWKNGDNCPFIYLSKKYRCQGAICPSREQEKQFSSSVPVSKREKLLGCSGSNVEACLGRSFLLLNPCSRSMVCAVLTSWVECHFAVQEGKSRVIC